MTMTTSSSSSVKPGERGDARSPAGADARAFAASLPIRGWVVSLEGSIGRICASVSLPLKTALKIGTSPPHAGVVHLAEGNTHPRWRRNPRVGRHRIGSCVLDLRAMRDKLARSNAHPVMVQAIIDVRRLLLLCCLCALAAPCGAQIYASNPDPQGSVVLSNFSSPATPNIVVKGDALSAQAGNQDALAPSREASLLQSGRPRAEIDQVVQAVAHNVGVPAELLHAVIRAESNYEQSAISPKGAIGLMQVMPETARRFGVADLRDIRSNVLAGASYLKWLIAYFDGRLELALAGYNAGEQAVVKAGLQIPAYPETRAYVRRVLKNLPPGFAATS